VKAIVDAGIPGAPALASGAASSEPTVSKAGQKRGRKPRGSLKHARGDGIIVADACAGVGPFAVPLARAGVAVHANDLNPESHRWLVKNSSTNKVQARLFPSNLDGAEFLRQLTRASQESDPVGLDSSIASSQSNGYDHILINLPASSVCFLPALRCIFNRTTWPRKELPIIHCYTFASAPWSRDGTLATLGLLEGGLPDPNAPDTDNADGVLASNRGHPEQASKEPKPSASAAASSSSSSSSSDSNHTAAERDAIALEDAT